MGLLNNVIRTVVISTRQLPGQAPVGEITTAVGSVASAVRLQSSVQCSDRQYRF